MQLVDQGSYFLQEHRCNILSGSQVTHRGVMGLSWQHWDPPRLTGGVGRKVGTDSVRLQPLFCSDEQEG